MDSKNYKTNKNRSKISSEEIASKKDFSSLKNSYNISAKPFYQSGWFIASSTIAAILIVSGILFTEINNNPESELINNSSDFTYQFNDNNNNDSIQRRFINPPFENNDIEKTKYIINPLEETNLKHKTGSSIHIPKQAFVDADGNPIKDKIEIYYREFHNIDDIIIAGIPMQYDSCGNKFHFETAGMIDISAMRNNKPVFIKPTKEIKIKMISDNMDPNFNLYYLDTNKRNWIYKGKDEIEAEITADNNLMSNKKTKKISKEIDKIQTQIKKIKKTKPIKPNKANTEKASFSIDVNINEFPEIAIYKNTLFEIDDEDTIFSENHAKIMWEDVELKKGKKKNNYIVKFTKGKRSVEYITYPVFDGKHYDDAIAVYEKKFSKYSIKLQERIEEEKRIREEQIKERKKRFQESSTRDKIYRTFALSNFGYWNCDKPQLLPEGMTVYAKFVDESKIGIDFSRVYLVERNKKAIFTYYNRELNSFKYNPKTENFIYGITPNGEFALCDYNEFNNSFNEKGKKVFVMKIIDSNFESVDEIKKMLDI